MTWLGDPNPGCSAGRPRAGGHAALRAIVRPPQPAAESRSIPNRRAALLAIAGSVLCGTGIALGGIPFVIAVLLIAPAGALLGTQDRLRLLVYAIVFLSAAIPHGASADRLLMLNLGAFRLYPLDLLVLTALALALAQLTARRRTALGRAGRVPATWIALAMLAGWSLIEAISGGLSGHEAKAVLVDGRPLLLYLMFVAPALLPRGRDDDERIAWLLLGGVAVISVLNVVATSGLLGSMFLTDAGRVWFRNGVLYPLALPLSVLGALRWTGLRRATAALLGIVCLVGMIASGTRAYWLAALAAVFACLILVMRRRSAFGRSRHASTVLVVGAVFGAALVAWVAMPQEFTAAALVRIGSFSTLSTDSSLTARIVTTQATNQLIAKNWLLGLGLGGRFSLYGGSGAIATVAGEYVDNVPQTALLRLGALGAAALAVAWVLAARAALRSKSNRATWLGSAVVASLPGLVVLMGTSSYLLTYNQIATLAIVFGVLAARGEPQCESAT